MQGASSWRFLAEEERFASPYRTHLELLVGTFTVHAFWSRFKNSFIRAKILIIFVYSPALTPDLATPSTQHATQTRQAAACAGPAVVTGASCRKYQFCRHKGFVAASILLSRQNTCYVCRDKHDFVATKVLSRQAYFCRDKRRVLWRQTRV